jgi:hypothetical protein
MLEFVPRLVLFLFLFVHHLNDPLVEPFVANAHHHLALVAILDLKIIAQLFLHRIARFSAGIFAIDLTLLEYLFPHFSTFVHSAVDTFVVGAILQSRRSFFFRGRHNRRTFLEDGSRSALRLFGFRALLCHVVLSWTWRSILVVLFPSLIEIDQSHACLFDI